MALLNNVDTFLIDQDFLRLLDLDREKEVFAKVVLLDFQEDVIEEIEGRVTQGSVTVDGTSSVRRTCSVSLVANELNIHEYYWGLHSKFQLYIGLKNVIKERQPYREKYKTYPDICWFKMGTYIISSFNTSQTTNQYTISIQGKDKMTLLNGEVGGIITPLSWDFGKIDEVSADGTIAHNDYLIKDIILEAVHEHAKEPYWNIIINDLEDCGLELLEYRGDIPLYLLYGMEEGIVVQTYFDLPPEVIGDKSIDEIKFDPRITKLDAEAVYDIFPIADENGNYHDYTIIKAEYGDVIGYRTTDLVYAGDLISNVGETVTAMLDKLIAMLGTFEYFYDLEGRFVFQKKPAYVKNLFVPAGQVGANDGSQTAAEMSSITYSFDNSVLVTSFSNQPDFPNLKNDFSLWGVRTGLSGIEIPIHLRYAIDTKPWYYKAYNGNTYITEEGIVKYNDIIENHKEWIKKYKIAEAENSGKTVFKKIAVPYFLQNEDGSSDWWDITNWAEYYKLLTGDYPNERIMDYGTEGFKGTLIFPNGTSENFSRKTRGQLVIDLERDTYNPFYHNPEGGYYSYSSLEHIDRNWSPFQHGFDGCGHHYTDFINLDAYNNCQSFIYKPDIPASITPDQIIIDIEDLIIEDEGKLEEDTTLVCDWREIIYQMSLDKNKHQHDDEFLVTVDTNNILPDGTHLYLGGATGYEQYYVDINGFWRDLYNPDYQFTYDVVWVKPEYFNAHKDEFFIYYNCAGMSYEEAKAAVKAWKDISGDRFFKLNYRNQWTTVSTIEPDYFNEHSEEYYFIRRCDALSTGIISFEAITYDSSDTYFTQSDGDYYKPEYDEETGKIISSDLNYWSSEFLFNPEGINFWFDFLDSESELGKYKVCKVGDRAKAANDTNIKSIYFRDVPTVIFVDQNSDIAEERRKKGTGYTYIQLPDYLENLFSMSSQGKSAMDILDDWLYSFAYCAESITINTLPIYYLQPNTRISVRDDNSGINGDYIVTRLTIPLTHNGTMSISATKAVESLY